MKKETEGSDGSDGRTDENEIRRFLFYQKQGLLKNEREVRRIRSKRTKLVKKLVITLDIIGLDIVVVDIE